MSTMKRRPFSLAVAVILLGIFFIYLAAFQVNETEVAVVFRFGKPVAPITEPGLYWKWPAPIQTVEKYDKRLRIFNGKFEQGLTKDSKNIIVESALIWRISDPLLFYTRVGSESDYIQKQESVVRSYQNGIIGQYDLNQFVNVDASKIKLDEIEAKVRRQVSESTTKQFGVAIADYKIERIAFPESTTKEVFERMKAKRNEVVVGIISDAEGRAKEIEAEALSRKMQELAKALAKAKELKAEADADAAQYYSVFQKDKNLAEFLFKLDALEKILKDRSTVILDTNTAPFDLLGGDAKP